MTAVYVYDAAPLRVWLPQDRPLRHLSHDEQRFWSTYAAFQRRGPLLLQRRGPLGREALSTHVPGTRWEAQARPVTLRAHLRAWRRSMHGWRLALFLAVLVVLSVAPLAVAFLLRG